MSRLAALRALPDTAMVPASYVRELLDEAKEQRIQDAVIREETIRMYCDLATRHYLCDPTRVE